MHGAGETDPYYYFYGGGTDCVEVGEGGALDLERVNTDIVAGRWN